MRARPDRKAHKSTRCWRWGPSTSQWFLTSPEALTHLIPPTRAVQGTAATAPIWRSDKSDPLGFSKVDKQQLALRQTVPAEKSLSTSTRSRRGGSVCCKAGKRRLARWAPPSRSKTPRSAADLYKTKQYVPDHPVPEPAHRLTNTQYCRRPQGTSPDSDTRHETTSVAAKCGILNICSRFYFSKHLPCIIRLP